MKGTDKSTRHAKNFANFTTWASPLKPPAHHVPVKASIKACLVANFADFTTWAFPVHHVPVNFAKFATWAFPLKPHHVPAGEMRRTKNSNDNSTRHGNAEFQVLQVEFATFAEFATAFRMKLLCCGDYWNMRQISKKFFLSLQKSIAGPNVIDRKYTRRDLYPRQPINQKQARQTWLHRIRSTVETSDAGANLRTGLLEFPDMLLIAFRR
jgi:hypothetical protein